MKYCPTCKREYDEEFLKFCMTDGTPLVDQKPVFKEIPSESSEEIDISQDLGEETVVRRNYPAGSDRQDSSKESDSRRIVISTEELVKPAKPQARAAAAPPRTPPPPAPKSNGFLISLVSILATIVVLGGIFGVYMMLRSPSLDDTNLNSNVDANANLADNTNANLDANSIFDDLDDNSNIDDNSNLSENTNLATPTPAPSPSPSPAKTPSPDPTLSPSPVPTTVPSATPSTTPAPKPTVAPTASPAATPDQPKPTPTSNSNSRSVNVGQINGRATRLPIPAYPAEARARRASGRVTVLVEVDERGNVIAANAISGHALLRRSAENAAKRSKFRPVLRNGRAVRSSGTIAYNFVR